MAGLKPTVEICECTISHHLEPNGRGGMMYVLDEVLPDLMTMAFGLCERCGKPFHDRSELGPADVEG